MFSNLKNSLSPVLFIALLIATIMSGFFWLSTISSASSTGDRQWDLQHNYQIGKTLTIEGVEDNLSGLTFHPPSGNLYAVRNNPEQIVVFTTAGKLLRTIDLPGFSDTESIDHIADNRFIIGEERLHTISFIQIDETTEAIHYSDVDTVAVAAAEKTNKGLEGLAFSHQHGLFLVYEEPAQIRHFALEASNDNGQFDAIKHVQFDIDDFSGLALLDDGKQQKLLVLSDESNSLHVIDLAGREHSRLRLGSGPFNFWPKLKQPEGIAVDTQGNIYIVGEPNQLLVLSRKTPML